MVRYRRAMETPLFDTPWVDPEERKRRVLAALEVGDVNALLEGFTTFLQIEGKRPETLDLYRRRAELFLRFVWGWLGRKGLKLAPGDVRAFYHHLEEEQGLGARAVRSARSVVLALARFFRWAGVGWPEAVEIPPVPLGPRRSRPITSEEEQRLLEAVRLWCTREGDNPMIEAALRLILDLGLSLRGLAELQVEDVDPLGRRVRIRDRWVPISKATAEALAAYLAWRKKRLRVPHDYLLVRGDGSLADPSYLRYRFYQYARAAGYDGGLRPLELRGQLRLAQRVGPTTARLLVGRRGVVDAFSENTG